MGKLKKHQKNQRNHREHFAENPDAARTRGVADSPLKDMRIRKRGEQDDDAKIISAKNGWDKRR